MAKNYGAESKSDLLRMDPDKLTIVTERGHELYDERVDLPIDEEKVASVLAVGVVEPIIIRENGRHPPGVFPDGATPLILEVVDGRQRVRWVREANRRLALAGRPPQTIPAIVRIDSGDEKVAMEIMIATNEIRTADPPSISAAKALRMQERGASVEAVARALGKPVTETKHLLAMAGLDHASKEALDKGVLPLVDAERLASLPKAERVAIVREAAASPEAKKKTKQILAKQAEARRAPTRSYVRAVRTKAEIAEAMAAFKQDGQGYKVLAWVLGQRDDYR